MHEGYLWTSHRGRGRSHLRGGFRWSGSHGCPLRPLLRPLPRSTGPASVLSCLPISLCRSYYCAAVLVLQENPLWGVCTRSFASVIFYLSDGNRKNKIKWNKIRFKLAIHRKKIFAEISIISFCKLTTEIQNMYIHNSLILVLQ